MTRPGKKRAAIISSRSMLSDRRAFPHRPCGSSASGRNTTSHSLANGTSERASSRVLLGRGYGREESGKWENGKVIADENASCSSPRLHCHRTDLDDLDEERTRSRVVT